MISKIFKKVKKVMFFVCMTMMAMPIRISADTGGGGSYVTAITNLKGIMTTIIVPLGAVLLVWGGVRFAIAFQKMDQNGEHSAINTIIAGGICIGITVIVSALS